MPLRFELGQSLPLEVRYERVSMGANIRLLYASDLHLRAGQGQRIIDELKRAWREARPQLVLLGGDLVDSLAGLELLEALVCQASQHLPVAAVAGNHDVIVGRAHVRQTIIRAGGYWLEDEPLRLEGLGVAGRVEQLSDGASSWVLCAHYPTVFPKAWRAGARLVLAGHLHGWQIVLGQWGEYLLPGALLSRWNGLRFERQGSTLLVSRGMADIFPLRLNCPREVIVVDLA